MIPNTRMLLELRHALRRLRRSLGFTAVAIVSLALGIGANSAIFNLIHAALMETVPVRDLDQLYWLRVDYPDGAGARFMMKPLLTPAWDARTAGSQLAVDCRPDESRSAARTDN